MRWAAWRRRFRSATTPQANEAAMDKVRADKQREAGDGHDGTWVAHPGLVAIAKEIFDQRDARGESDRAQAPGCARHRRRSAARSPKARSPRPASGRISMSGIGYLEAWLRGIGCVPLYNLMEDAATAEISRAQIWQWIRHGAKLDGWPHRRSRRSAMQGPRRGACQAARDARPARTAATTMPPAIFRDLIERAALPGIPDHAGLRDDHIGSHLDLVNLDPLTHPAQP